MFRVIFFVFALSIPLYTHAGILSSLLGLPAAADTKDLAVVIMNSPQNMPLLKAVVNSDPSAARGGGDILVESDGVLVSDIGPDGVHEGLGSKDVTGVIHTYTVKESDSLSEIAALYDVSVNTILWANDVKDPKTIRPGDTLIILPVSGVRHVVKSGDTLQSLSKKYSGDVDDIVAYNRLIVGADLVPGETVVIPGGEVAAPPVPKKVPAKSGSTGGGILSASGYFTRPISTGKTQGLHGYNGIDFGAPEGTTVRAAAAGTVILARGGGGWNGGYGNYIVVKHANGMQTLYAHLSSITVSVGAPVKQGQAIGSSGNTGKSTGPHLHFEVRGGKNPF